MVVSDADCRAEIPTLLTAAEQQRHKQLNAPQCRQRGGWRDGERPELSDVQIVEFVQTYAWPKETEMALQSLFEADYDVPAAVEVIHEARREKLRLKREEAERIHTLTFEKAMDRHGKKFHLVKRRLGRQVTTRELVSKFYMWKKTPEYEQWHERQREKKRSREAKRLARLRPAADQHREYCEMCLKGGKLLCCDGCERAYHLNCVRPALLDVPEGDWFCSHCRDTPPQPLSAKTGGNVCVPVPTTSNPASKPKTKANGSSLKGASGLLTISPVHNVTDKVKTTALATKKSSKKSNPTVVDDPDVTSSHVSEEKLTTNDAISDITTESESDGGAAKVFQSLSPNCIVSTPTRKRKQKHAKVEAGVRRPHYTSPSRSLEYLSSPLQAARRETGGTIAAFLALSVLAVTEEAQRAPSTPALRGLRQSADTPATEDDEDWKTDHHHHHQHHHHVKKVKKIAIPVPVEVPQFIPVPVSVPSTVVANSNTAVVAPGAPGVPGAPGAPGGAPGAPGAPATPAPTTTRGRPAATPAATVPGRARATPAPTSLAGAIAPAAQQPGAFPPPAGISSANSNALGAGLGANGGGFPAAGGAFGGNPMGGFGAGNPMGGTGGGFGAGNRFGGGMLGGAGMSGGGFNGNGMSGFGAQGGNAFGGQGAMGSFGPVGANAFAGAAGGQAGAGFGGGAPMGAGNDFGAGFNRRRRR
ncbi:hypothetical protein PF011_g4236 [Phytophthora fragariae]|uniref:Uncharacterized protein n=1 Tax=Phytophthora fragariae TaxID=53985 RepID=A0A6A3LYN5_9STRA|nr:hypothetical protein PF011_g4236 [Phytophthora fragariae]